MNLLVPALGAFVSGFFPALVASALVCYAALPGFSTGDLSFVASALFFGKVAASVFGGWLSDRMGRSAAIRSAGAVSVFAAVPLVLGRNTFVSVVFGMGLEGFALGLFSILLPLHLVETQPLLRQGRASAEYQFCNTAGLLAGAFVGLIVAASDAEPSVAVRIEFLVFLPVAVLFLMLSFGLTGGDCRTGRNRQTCPWRPFARPLLRAVALLSLTSAMGIGVISCSAVLLLQRVGLEGASSNGVYFALGLVSLAAAGLSGLVQKRANRLTVLQIGSVGTVVSLVLMAIAFARLLPACFAVFLLLYMGFFVFGPGAAAWTIAGDLLPQEIRAKGMSLALLANQLITALLTAAFLPLAARIGFVPIFLFFSGAAIAYCVLVRV